MNDTISTQKPVFEDLVIRNQKPKQAAEPMMASYLTHELRAPVTAIRLGLEILQEQTGDRLAPDEKQMLALAVKNTSRLQTLVNDIMDYTKVISGKMNLKLVATDCRDMVSEVTESFQAWAITKGIRLVKEDPGPLPRVMADADRIIQVLTNLVSNALKFTPARGIVSISVKEGTGQHAGTLIFKVKDTGCGIPEKDLEKIFESFVQSAENGKQCDGTGLGLTLARSMIQLHGGRIWAESWKGIGSSFFFTVPICAADLPEPVEVYPQPTEYHGLLMNVYRRLNAFMALFV